MQSMMIDSDLTKVIYLDTLYLLINNNSVVSSNHNCNLAVRK